MNRKGYKYFSKISFVFVAVYAFLGIVLTAFFEIDFINTILAPLKIFHLILPVFAIIVCFSWPFFGPIAIGSLIIKIIMFVRNKPSERKMYIKDMILHFVCSVVGMAGIFAMYYDKFGNPFT